ncbi:MAG: hypothetical protein ACR2NU_16250 [Aeoliella sp.]
MAITTKQIGSLSLALALLMSAGCWEEIRYDPTSEPSTPPPQPVVQSQEVRVEENENVMSPPSAEDLFAQRSVGETASNDMESPPEDNSKEPERLWGALDSQTEITAETEPAPPAKMDWPDNELEQAIAVPLEAAWRLGSKWSLAVGIYGKGFGVNRYGNVLQQAADAARDLDVALPAIPEDADDVLPTAIGLLLDSEGPHMARLVGAAHTSQHQTLCELAIRSHALLLSYSPTDSDVDSLLGAIRPLVEASSLPAHLWLPLVQTLEQRADYQDVKRAVLDLHEQASDYLGDLPTP